MCLFNNAFPHFSSPSIANFLNSFVSIPSPFSLTQSKLSFPHYLFLLCVVLVTYFTSVNDVWVNLYCLCCFLAYFRFCSTMIFLCARALERVCVCLLVSVLICFLSFYRSTPLLPTCFLTLCFSFLFPLSSSLSHPSVSGRRGGTQARNRQRQPHLVS